MLQKLKLNHHGQTQHNRTDPAPQDMDVTKPAPGHAPWHGGSLALRARRLQQQHSKPSHRVPPALPGRGGVGGVVLHIYCITASPQRVNVMSPQILCYLAHAKDALPTTSAGVIQLS